MRRAAVLVAAACVAACAGRPSRPVAGVAAPTVDNSEARQGREAAARLFGRDRLTGDDRLLRYVNLVGRSLGTPRFRFAVTESEAPYSLALPGDVIVVSRGALSLLGSEAELAVVLAREICRREAVRRTPGGALRSDESDSLADPDWDACGAARASALGYDAAAFLHLLDALAGRAGSAREKLDAQDRIRRFRDLPEFVRGGKTLAERFHRSAIS
jgi:hypothetical protein